MPGVWAVTSHAPQNHLEIGIFVRCMTVLAVRLVSCWCARQRRMIGRPAMR
jgi:hypothetical protein